MPVMHLHSICFIDLRDNENSEGLDADNVLPAAGPNLQAKLSDSQDRFQRETAPILYLVAHPQSLPETQGRKTQRLQKPPWPPLLVR